MTSIKQYKGFAVLTSVVLLSLASITFTAEMASTQLIDNKIVGNYYRNNEAFVNAESGINFLLSKIDDPVIGPVVVASIPFTYSSTDNHYNVQLTRLDDNTLEIVSAGLSMDDSAQREISLQIHPEMRFNLPGAAVSFNGKLNLDASATVNNGCEGVSAANCKSPGNFADFQVVSHPANETERTADLCNGSVDDVDNTGVNLIADNAFYQTITADNSLEIGANNAEGKVITWSNNIAAGSDFFGTTVATDLEPSSLFESTFGVSKDEGVAALKASDKVAKIDMTDGSNQSCSERLEELDPKIVTIYITGDCDIGKFEEGTTKLSENGRFTIGTLDNPKMVFIEGGTFIDAPNTGSSVVGMLYFLPGTSVNETEDSSVDMGGVRVNGALLSEYSCSHDGYDRSDPTGTKQHFSARYDKTVLDTLYGSIGRQAPIYIGYSFVQGSWRDF